MYSCNCKKYLDLDNRKHKIYDRDDINKINSGECLTQKPYNQNIAMKIKIKQVRYKWEILQILFRKAWTDKFIYLE